MEVQRYPLSVHMTGVMHKEKSKMYVASVLWSDHSDIVVYRTLEEFHKLHKQMKKAFPATSKLNKSERIIPKFRAVKKKQGYRKKYASKSLVRLKLLEKYSNELLSCDPRVTQCADVVQFFHPTEQDLQPEFFKNSVIIMPTEGDRAATGHPNGGHVTQPFVAETYRCIATYETKDTKNKPFQVAVDERVDVLIKDKAGWWLVESEDKRMAWFPAPYLEKLGDAGDDTDGIPGQGLMCTAIKSYKATKDDELTVSIGATVEVLQKSETGWWLIRYQGKTGYVPTMYLQPYNYAHMRLKAHHPDHHHHRPPSVLLAPSPMLEKSPRLSHSQGNLLLLPPPVRSSSPNTLQPDTKERSRSLNVLSDQPPAQPAWSTSATAPPPAIMVEMDGGGEERRGHNLSAESMDSFGSSGSDDISFSRDLSSSSASSSLNLSLGANDERLRLSRTPPPGASKYLSPTDGPGGKLMPSVSDPNIYKGPSRPKLPPRPQAQEILSRCTTVTRKKASRGGVSPAPPEILSQ